MMAEWWSYQPSDFLLFSARTYQRLFELYNAQIWPAQLLAAALGLALAAALAMRAGATVAVARAACALLAASWLWVGWAFHLQRYAAINWAAIWFGAAFAIEGVLLLLLGAGLRWQRQHDWREKLGLALLFFALVIQPWAVLVLTGRPWREVEVFGLAPDPTAFGTLGLLLVLRPPRAARALALLLWPIPLLWCLVGALTRWTLVAAPGG
ncbi:DUF6064 family protein [Variovorax sp. LARHSF232]